MTRRSKSRTSPKADFLQQGRESFRKKAWGSAFSQLSAADKESPLDPVCLLELAQAALLIGKDLEGTEFLATAHQGFLRRGDTLPAVRCAFWLGFTSLLNGEVAKAGGWLARAARLIDGCPPCVEHGYLLLPTGYRLFHEGDAGSAYASFEQATSIGERFDDRDLVTLGLQGQGRSLIRQGKIAEGLALLDEAMVAVTAGEVSALNAGGVYCSVLDACGEIFDLQRAREWTAALDKWCASQPDIVPYRGHCLVRRAELLQLHGNWRDALQEAERASELFSRPVPKHSAGPAYYQVGEIQRLRGRFAEAEAAYQQAGQWQSSPGPGLARLRLAQGQKDAANTAIRRMAGEDRETGGRARILDAYVEIVLAANDVAAARTASDELAEIAGQHGIAFLRALSCRATGAVLLAEGDPRSALIELRQSWSIWCELQAPYEAARVRLLIAQACRGLGDEANALLGLTAARQTFMELGAAVDLAQAEALLSKDGKRSAGPLSGRELEILRLVATGLTNRRIAERLHISDKTVARHVSNIFTKLDLSSRSAATAYAYDHKLV
jgi:DNA-binding CsgD family transcriptional regulator/tetratricopeptide (TPR) repeat protein